MRLKAICRAFFIDRLQWHDTWSGRRGGDARVGRAAVLHGRFVPVRWPRYTELGFLSVNDDLTERLVERQVVHEGTYMAFTRDTVLDADGKKHTRDVVLHPGAVTIVAISPDRRVLLVRQYRHAAGEALLELPAGTLDRQPDGSMEDRLLAAKRELTEETGYRADKWRELATFFTAPGFASELMTIFLATDVTPDPEFKGPDPDERLKVEMVPFDDDAGRGQERPAHDAKTILGVLLVDALEAEGPLRPGDRCGQENGQARVGDVVRIVECDCVMAGVHCRRRGEARAVVRCVDDRIGAIGLQDEVIVVSTALRVVERALDRQSARGSIEMSRETVVWRIGGAIEAEVVELHARRVGIEVEGQRCRRRDTLGTDDRGVPERAGRVRDGTLQDDVRARLTRPLIVDRLAPDAQLDPARSV